MKCSYCGKPLNTNYVMVSDEWLRENFFDANTPNAFCDRLCLCEFIGAIDMEKDTEPDFRWHPNGASGTPNRPSVS